MKEFAAVQSRLAAALAAHRPGSVVPHVVVALPSFGVGAATMRHYGHRLTPLEHRFLHTAFALRSVPGCEVVVVCGERPAPEVLRYYASVGSPADQDGFLSRLHVLHVPRAGDGPRSVTLDLLDRPDLLDRLAQLVGSRPALFEPWNVTAPEVHLVERTGIPVNGPSATLWPLGFKSAGRRLLRRAGVPVPAGVEGVRDLAGVVAAAEDVRARQPAAPAVLVKLDNSSSGDGNLVVPLRDGDGRPLDGSDLAAHLAGVPAWYAADLADGCVVEELVTGPGLASPSVQADILPDGEVRVRGTHEQVLGGDTGQVYQGCRFPADPAYAARLADHGARVGGELAAAGVVGRFAVDFVAVQEQWGGWRLCALEINLRKGGTSHPLVALAHLVPGRYEPDTGWVAGDGRTRCYTATDNLVDPAWLGLAPTTVLAAVEDAGLRFDHRSGTGVVLHSLSGLDVDGRIGLTAFARTTEQADALADAVSASIGAAAVGERGPRTATVPDGR